MTLCVDNLHNVNMSTLNYDFIAALHLADRKLTYKRHTIDRPDGLIA